jgi:malate dehydrogenase
MSVAIIGAGPVGGALAHGLASRDRVRRIRLIDADGTVAAGKALDIQQASPTASTAARVVASTDPDDALRCEVVVLADSAATGGEWTGAAGLALLKRIVPVRREPVVVCAGAGHLELIEQGTRDLHIPRSRLIGSAPLALASAIRSIAALETDGSPADVALTLVGRPPDHVAVAWTEATIAGSPAASVLTPPQLARLAAMVRHLWPPGPYSLAAAAARVCEAILHEGRGSWPCFVALDGEAGERGRVTACPVVLGRNGVRRVVVPALSPRERTIFES